MAPDISVLHEGGEKTGVVVNEQPLFTPRRLRVVCVGAGVAGLTLAYKLKYGGPQYDFIDWTIYEKNHDVGGTWLENTYPGVACDVPAHIYTFLFEPNPDWSEFYASGPEIQRYIKRTTDKYGLDEKVQFNSKITQTIWDDSKGKWTIKIHKTDSDTVVEDEADVLINSAGFLNKWKWPDIKGLDTYKGQLLHSASWNHNLDWENKKVAIIGNGSSAIQILPQMQKKAKHITTYIRTPTWISPNFVAQFTKDGSNFKYTDEEKEAFRQDPEKLKQYRREIEHSMNSYFFGFFKDSELQTTLRGAFKESMEDRLKDPALREQLIPDWHVGCRRLTPGPGYLEALQEDNVSVRFGAINSITETGILAQGQDSAEDFDIIVCATGFDVSFCPFWKLRGKDGLNLSEQWRDKPEAYFGICAPHVPNYFMFTGPNAPVGHGSISIVYDASTDYMLRWCQRIASTGIKAATVKEDATREYNDYIQEWLKRMVWASGCKSWYKAGKVDGPITALYGGSVFQYKEILDSFRVEDFDIEYHDGNRFRFMGNGLTERELKGHDLAFYIR